MFEFGPRTQVALTQLTVEEKAAITAGSGFFTMTGVDRLGIANWLTTDGPNGARGSSFLGSGDSKATCIPCGSALGATWNPALVEELGVLLGSETRTKACRVLLAPTVNLHRSPLAGRNFECYSEDPLLSGKLAAAYIRGVQSQGVITTVKHFVGNETETDRWTSNSIIDERALRELYLVPFELSVTEGGTLGVMTSYNRLNGRYCTEQRELLSDILRGEWGFEGFVTTDWMAGASTTASAEAGLGIEMPSGDRAFGSKLAQAVRGGDLDETVLDIAAGQMLSAFERIGAWDDEPGAELSIDREDHRELARRAAADAMVLLRNEPVDDQPLLPLEGVSSIAVIGQNAIRAQIMGGGSANLRPFHRTSPLEALTNRLGDHLSIAFEPGCTIDKEPPLLSGPVLVSPTGEQGFLLEVFDNTTFSGDPIGTANRDTSRLLFGSEVLPGIEPAAFSVRSTTHFTPTDSGSYTFALTQVSPSRVLLNGTVLADGVTSPPPVGQAFFGFGQAVEPVTVELVAGETYVIEIELISEDMLIFGGADLRVAAPFPPDAFERAVTAAANAEVAIVVVGTNDDWETEGEDRTTLSLPGDQNALVSAVVAANPRTVVVVNAGAPVTMPWADDVPAILICWLGGQEMANALVDVITGESDPGGRLPTTFPLRIEHTPSYGSFPGDNGQTPYSESIFMGYRWYQSRKLPCLYPFGHGLSYAHFDIGEPSLSATELVAGDTLTVDVAVTNTSRRTGSHVVQCYVRPRNTRIARPESELKAFAKVALEPGQSTTVSLELDDRAFAYWDPAQPEWPELRDQQAETLPQLQSVVRRTSPGWTIDAGSYDIVIATSATKPVSAVTIRHAGTAT